MVARPMDRMRRTRRIVCTLGLVAAACGTVAPAGAASFPNDMTPLPRADATNTGAISGTVVRAADSVPLDTVRIEVRVAGNLTPVATGATDVSGHFQITDIPAGGYTVRFEDTSRALAIQYWPLSSTLLNAGVAQVIPGVTTTGIDAALAPGNTISGVIAERGTGVPIKNACAFVLDPRIDSIVNAIVSVGVSDATGTYTSSVLPPGQYKMLFGDCQAPYRHRFRFFGDGGYHSDASLVTITAQYGRPSADGGLLPVGIISGRIFDAPKRGPLPAGEWCAVVFAVLDGERVMTNSVPIARDGSYSIGIPTDNAYVAAAHCDDLLPVEWFDGDAGIPVREQIVLNPGGEGARLLLINSGSRVSSIDIPIGAKPPPAGITVEGNSAAAETGETLPGELPQTGNATIPMTYTGFALILIGAALALSGRVRAENQ